VGGWNPLSSPSFFTGGAAGEDHKLTRYRFVARVVAERPPATAHGGTTDEEECTTRARCGMGSSRGPRVGAKVVQWPRERAQGRAQRQRRQWRSGGGSHARGGASGSFDRRQAE
jgi:hypothetical protein